MDLLQHSAWHLRSIYAGGSVLMKANENSASTREARRPHLSTTCKHNPLVRAYEPYVDNLVHELRHIKKYFNVEQVLNFP